jgi:hypothetical protein
MLPGFPVPIPWIMFLTAGPVFHGALGSDFLKIFDENPAVISQKGFENVGFDEIQVCPIRGRFFGGARTFFNKL